MKKELEKKIIDAIEEIRPIIQSDGGDIEFSGVLRNVVAVKISGKCKGCPMQNETLQKMVLPHIKKSVPTIKGITVV